jgi:DNA-binding beta-propeller fold protein YncE
MKTVACAGRRVAAALSLLGLAAGAAQAQLMIIGNDQKPSWDANMKPVMREPGHDTLSIIDMSQPAKLKMIATIPLDNSIVGPPTNLAITPDRSLALVANSVNGMKKPDGTFGIASDDRLFVVDLKANPPAVSATVKVGKRPSGLAIAPDGKWALVTNRDDGTISLLTISGKEVKVADTVTVGEAKDQVAAVAITPDGKRALIAKPGANAVAIVSIDNGKVTYDKQNNLPTGIFPYNVVISPNGKLALTADNGHGGSSDGNVDTVGVIDLEANPPRVIDHIVVSDSPEGLAISPKGNIAVSIDAYGSNQPKSSWFQHDTGIVSVMRIDGKKVTKIAAIPVGRFPEGAAFSADGKYIYVGNFIDKDLSVLRVDGTRVSDTGTRYPLPGQPASMRGGPQ